MKCWTTVTRTAVYRFKSTQIKSDRCPLSVKGVGSALYHKEEKKILFNDMLGAMSSDKI